MPRSSKGRRAAARGPAPGVRRTDAARSEKPAPPDRFATVTAPLLAFAGSGCLLVLEIVAGRLIAPALGVSLYTWTSVIGVVLAGVSAGNFLGGWAADRWPSRSIVAVIYAVASVSAVLVLAIVKAFNSLLLPSSSPAIVQVLWITAVLFFLPSTCMAAATPVLTRLSLHSVAEGGRVVGRIQAAAALGSITGTFLTGFVLISEFGTHRIVVGIAVILLGLAVAARPPWLRRAVPGVALLLVVFVAVGWKSQADCLVESNYYCIRVIEPTSTAGGQVTQLRGLFLDHLLHGVVDLDNPTFLYYPYEKDYAEVVQRLHPPHSTVDAFFAGGGAYTFPRWLAAHFPGRILVAEIDPEVTKIVRTRLGLGNNPRIANQTGDARDVLASEPATEKYDFVLGDAFDDFEVPYHLTTEQYDALISAHLKPDGIYLANIIDGVRYDFLRSEVRTLQQVFPWVGLIAQPADWPVNGTRATYVIVAAKHKPAKALPVVPQSQLDAFIANGHSVVLTDQYAPVDELLAPVFSQSLHERS